MKVDLFENPLNHRICITPSSSPANYANYANSPDP